MYTVKQVSELTKVTVRTLHYYDEIDLFKPTQIGTNGYRYYDDAALLRLQQILFYRELGLELMAIKDILDRPDFDLVSALQSHRKTLEKKADHLHTLLNTIDDTIRHVTGEDTTMSKKRLFKGFTEEEQEEKARLARLEYGPDLVNESMKRWNNYPKAHQEAIMDEASEIYVDMRDAMLAGKTPQDEDVQKILVRWHDNIRHFYEPTLEILAGLGETYNTHPDFMANFQKVHPDLPEYLQLSIRQYVDDLEYAAIAQMLAEDEAENADT